MRTRPKSLSVSIFSDALTGADECVASDLSQTELGDVVAKTCRRWVAPLLDGYDASVPETVWPWDLDSDTSFRHHPSGWQKDSLEGAGKNCILPHAEPHYNSH
ncbi:hypothetical protein LZ32DRAFT_255483 [Colletotrichum eremochloae]|nr:hypothetical protein LZ32DRAFT_255483 [Colletotrichum eremochloae]